ncbi:MAG: PKD domain-containing protein, partial [Acidimicrobiales bacterium]
ANDYAQKKLPGLQTLASPPTGDAGPSGRFTTRLQAIYMPAAELDAPLAGQVHWDFGDGSHAATGYLSVGQDSGQTGQGTHGKPVLFNHSFRPGTYRVRATGQDTDGNPVSWTITVRVFPRLRVSCSGRVRGGEGTVLRRIRRRHSITVVDAAGGTATARCP